MTVHEKKLSDIIQEWGRRTGYQLAINHNLEVRSLSWKEPYGSLMLPPINKIETRSRSTSYRGIVLLCTSQKPWAWNQVRDISGGIQFNRILITLDSDNQLGEGANAFAIGRLTDCRPMRRSDADRCFVRFNAKRWCWTFQDIVRIEPFAWKGSQGLRRVPAEKLDKIQFL